MSFAAVSQATCLEHFCAAMAVQGLCAGFTMPAQGAFAAEITPQDKRGQAMSLQRQAGSVTSLLGPVSFGLLADTTSCTAAVGVTAALMGSCNVMYALKASTVVATEVGKAASTKDKAAMP
jgi:MFS family permease